MALSRYRRDAEYFDVVTPFAWNERHFSEGESFPANELGLGEMERRQLWVANKIRVVDAPPAPLIDPRAGLLALAAFGAAVPPPASSAKPAKRPRAGA